MVNDKLYGNYDDVRQLTNISSDELTDEDIQGFLQRASNKIVDLHGETTGDKFIVWANAKNGSTNRVYKLHFAVDVETTPEVYHQGAIMTESTDYTLSGRTLTVDSDFSVHSGEVLVVIYTPDLYNDYASHLAAQAILQRTLVNAGEAGQALNPVHRALKDEAERYEKMLSQRPVNASWVDQKEGLGVF